jgi:hypothetical protein
LLRSHTKKRCPIAKLGSAILTIQKPRDQSLKKTESRNQPTEKKQKE